MPSDTWTDVKYQSAINVPWIKHRNVATLNKLRPENGRQRIVCYEGKSPVVNNINNMLIKYSLGQVIKMSEALFCN